MVSQELLEELGALLKQKYGLNLTPEALAEIGNSAVNYVDLLAEIYYSS